MGVMDGVKVLEVAEHGFVPSAAAILAEWGADVVKVERPTGDPLRQIMAMGFVTDTGDFNFLFEQFNRNKRGVAIDLRNDEGRAALDRLIAWADVFITNFLPSARTKLTLDPDDIWAVNPKLRVRDRFRAGPRRVPMPTRAVSTRFRTGRAAASRTCSRPQGGQLVQPRGALGDAPSGAYLAGRSRGRVVQARAHRRADRRRRVAARRGGVDAVERPRSHHDPRRRTAAPRRGQEPEQRARRIVPHRRRTLDQPEHARSRPALGADVSRARARGAARQPRLRDRGATPGTRARAAPDPRRAHRVAAARRPEGTAVGARHDLLVDRVAASRSSTTRRCSRTATCRTTPATRPRGSRRRRCSSTARVSRSGAARPEIGEHTDEVFREIGVDDAELARLHEIGALA